MALNILIYIVLCIVIGLIGHDKKFGFWGYFIVSLILTPIVGILLMIIDSIIGLTIKVFKKKEIE